MPKRIELRPQLIVVTTNPKAMRRARRKTPRVDLLQAQNIGQCLEHLRAGAHGIAVDLDFITSNPAAFGPLITNAPAVGGKPVLFVFSMDQAIDEVGDRLVGMGARTWVQLGGEGNSQWNHAVIGTLQGDAVLELNGSRVLRDLAGNILPMVGRAPKIVEAFKEIAKLAPFDINVLILGETGVGKELAARKVHELCPQRCDGPFVAVSGPELSGTDGAVASALFGHLKGSFTGADEDREGLIHAASGGTLFIDEVALLSLVIQEKLLRVLAEGDVMRVGSKVREKVSLRVVCATNEDLKPLIAQGRFREDLYHRLVQTTVSIPPLRERRQDIPDLARLFAAQFAPEGSEPKHLDDAVGAELSKMTFPGNVRDLRNLMLRAIIQMPPGRLDITWNDLVAAAGSSTVAPGELAPPLPLDEVVNPVERQHLEYAMEWAQGNVTKAANQLKKDRQTVVRLLLKHGLDSWLQ